MINAGFSPGLPVYNSVIKACRDVPLKAEFFFKKMKAEDIVPNTETFMEMIKLYYKSSLSEKVIEMFTEMQHAGLVPDTKAYNMVISACGILQEFREAVRFFTEMQDAGFVADNSTYSTIVFAYVEMKDLKQALRVFSKMKQAGVTPHANTYSAIIFACFRDGFPEKAAQYHVEMLLAGLAPDMAIQAKLGVQHKFGLRRANLTTRKRSSRPASTVKPLSAPSLTLSSPSTVRMFINITSQSGIIS